MRGVTAGTPTWLAVRQILHDRCVDFSRQLTAARESLDPEAIHDLRVSSRRLREGLAVFADCFKKRRLAPIRTRLKELTVMLGLIRNADEAILFFSPLLADCRADTAAVVTEIVAALQERRGAEQHKLTRELQDPALDALPDRIAALCRRPRIFAPGADGLLQPVGSGILAAMALREKAMLALLPEALIRENSTAQHRLRVAVKRFRYRVELLAPFAGSDYKGVYGVIKEYQEILGHMHDLDVFSEMIPAGTGGAGGETALVKTVSARRAKLFTAFVRLNRTDPLQNLGDRLRGLL